jgi:hypothetical protein
MVVGLASRVGKVVHPCRVVHTRSRSTLMYLDFNVEFREGLMED